MIRPKAKIHYYPGKRCVICNQPFTELNLFTEAGHDEVSISQICEVCFNYLSEEWDRDPVSTTVDKP